jgi:hypothetical protein
MTLNLKQTHPNLYRGFMAYGLLSVALGLNFLVLNPTFEPFGIPKDLCGVVFLALGLSQLVWLNVVRHTALLRLTMAATIGVMFFWAAINTAEFFRLGQTSLQLPIVFYGLAALGMPLLTEPSTNPLTSQEESAVLVGGVE